MNLRAKPLDLSVGDRRRMISPRAPDEADHLRNLVRRQLVMEGRHFLRCGAGFGGRAFTAFNDDAHD